MAKNSRKPNVGKSKTKVGITHRSPAKRRRAKKSDEIPGTLNWDDRYGDIKTYKKRCAIAHKSAKRFCCVCLSNPSQELHHAQYGKDVIGLTVFPVCLECHKSVCHSNINWIKTKKDPVWGCHNTPEFIRRLEIGYKLLHKGIEL